jgi:uncharacterized protein (TIRG00374 family)
VTLDGERSRQKDFGPLIMKPKSSSENDQEAPALWNWRAYLSIAIAIGILVFLASRVDLGRIWHELAGCEKRFVLLGALAHYATYPIRGLRWWLCLKHFPERCSKAKLVLLVFFYNAVDNVVPAKLGDLYGAHLARINCGIRRSTALGSILFLRMVDAWFVLLLASVTAWFLFSTRLPDVVKWALIGGAVIAIGVTLIILSLFFLRRSLPKWLPEKIREMIDAFRGGMWPRLSETAPIALLTAVIWSLETLFIFFVAFGLGLRLSVMEAVLLTMIPVLATAFPITPSGTGVVELALFGCLRVVGVSSLVAASMTVVVRFVDYWLHIGLGVLIWAIKGKIGLGTWHEVSRADVRGTYSSRSLARQEDLS